MGEIQTIGKWDLEKGIWIKNPNKNQIGRSLAFVNYEPIVNHNGKINYIIMANGTRVEDHTKNYQTVKEKKCRMDTILSHYKKKTATIPLNCF